MPENLKIAQDAIKKEVEKQDKVGGQLLTKELQFPDSQNYKIFKVYDIPLSLLTFNKYNGRIASDMLTYERALGTEEGVNPNTAEGERIIRNMLLASTDDKISQETLKIKQKEIAIITEDGVIIDGNKRTCLLKENYEKDPSLINTLRTVILPVSNLKPEEIESYETLYQIGGEPKEDYKPINTYLKIRRMYLAKAQNLNTETNAVAAQIFDQQQDVSNTIDTENLDDNAIRYIAKKYGHYKTIKGESGVKKALRVMNVMESYLRAIQCPNTYRLLYDREEQFRGLEDWLRKYKNASSEQCFSEFSDLDYDNLKNLAYDYILAKTTNQDFRNIGGRKKRNHIIGNKKAWDKLVNGWHDIFENESRDLKVDISFQNQKNIVENIIEAEKTFIAKFKSKLDDNITNALEEVERDKRSAIPRTLVQGSIDNIKALFDNPGALHNPEVQTLVSNLIDVAESIVTLNSLGSLRQVEHTLNKSFKLIGEDIDKMSDIDKEEVQNIVKNIQKVAFKIEKKRFNE